MLRRGTVRAAPKYQHFDPYRGRWKRGWLPGLLQKPKGIHRMMSMIQAPSLHEYLDDLKAALSVVRAERAGSAKLQATY